MFTGLVEEIGKVLSIERTGNAARLMIDAKEILSDLKIDDSVAVNGVCLTVIKVLSNGFLAEAVEETISKTTLSLLKTSSKVNLERALTLSTRLGGHLVLGHIDTIGKVLKIRKQTLGTLITFSYPREYSKYLVNTGSICIDGVSLTLAEYSLSDFTVSVIPHTISSTIIQNFKQGTEVNLEFDIIGKYVEKMVTGKSKFEGKLKEFLIS
jgi:riboflavin synthase